MTNINTTPPPVDGQIKGTWRYIEPWKSRLEEAAHFSQEGYENNKYHFMQAEIDELRAENARLREANKLLDDALMEASPYGAAGKVFDLWNAARAALGEK